jgi:hypothetical protein
LWRATRSALVEPVDLITVGAKNISNDDGDEE